MTKGAAMAIILVALFQQPANFSGNWELDRKQSANLPGSFAQVESYTMNIRQTADSLIVVAGLRGNGQNVTFPVTNYAFDGTEVFREDPLRHSKRWIKSAWEQGGKKLVVTSRVIQGAGDKETEYTQRDEWRLKDARTMEITLTQKYARGDSVRNERRIFHRTK